MLLFSGRVAHATLKNDVCRWLAVCKTCGKSNIASQDSELSDLNTPKDVNTIKRITVPKGIKEVTAKSVKGCAPKDVKDSSQDLLEFETTFHHTSKKSTRKGKFRNTRVRMDIPKIPLQGEIIYGKFPVFIALKAKKREIYKLYLKTSIFESSAAKGSGGIHDQLIAYGQDEGITIEPVSQEVLNALVSDPSQGLRQHQGICADVSPRNYMDINPGKLSPLSDERSKPHVWLILESVQDPNNFGAILRSAHYLGVDRVIAHNSCKLSPAVSKVSAGALEVMDVYNCDNLTRLLQTCRDAGWQILGTTGMRKPSASAVPLDNVCVNRNTIIVMGNEGSGLSNDTDNLCDQHVVVGRHGVNEEGSRLLLDSLNVSVATGIMLHDLLYKRNNFPR